MRRRSAPSMSRSSRFRGLFAIAAASIHAGLLTACVASPSAVETPGPQESALVLSVRNENPTDVRVYAVRGTLRHRLGIVPTMRTEYFRIPPDLCSAGSLQFRADPIGGAPGYLTEPVLIGGVHRIDLRLQAPFAYSSIVVR